MTIGIRSFEAQSKRERKSQSRNSPYFYSLHLLHQFCWPTNKTGIETDKLKSNQYTQRGKRIRPPLFILGLTNLLFSSLSNTKKEISGKKPVKSRERQNLLFFWKSTDIKKSKWVQSDYFSTNYYACSMSNHKFLFKPFNPIFCIRWFIIYCKSLFEITRVHDETAFIIFIHPMSSFWGEK